MKNGETIIFKIYISLKERVREHHRDRDRERQSERERDRQPGRQADKQRRRQKDRKRGMGRNDTLRISNQ